MTVLTSEITDDTATGRWEACPAFAAGEAGSGVCGECGWLEHEHRGSVRPLRGRAPRSARPDRLAS
jgi:hypothetical protein